MAQDPSENQLAIVETDVVWETNPRGGVMTHHNNVVVVPSRVGFTPPGRGAGRARREDEEPSVGLKERCILYPNPGGSNIYFAFPNSLEVDEHNLYYFIPAVNFEVTVIPEFDATVQAHREGDSIVIRVTPK